MNDNQAMLDLISEAAGDGYVNGTSMSMNNIMRARNLIFGHGAGDPAGNIRMMTAVYRNFGIRREFGGDPGNHTIRITISRIRRRPIIT